MRIYLIVLYLIGSLGQLLGQARLLPNSVEGDCCYSFNCSLRPNDPSINQLEIILPQEVSWASIRPDLVGGWRIYPLNQENGFQLIRVNAANDTLIFPPLDTAFFSACFDLPSNTEAFSAILFWKKDGELRAAEQLDLECGQCTRLFEEEAICQDSSGYLLEFRFVNLSAYPIDEIRLSEFESQGVLPSITVPLVQRLMPEDTSETISLTLDSLAENYDELCFYLTGSRFENQFRLDCCSSLQCIELPICDRCCTEFEEFEEAAIAGFDIQLRNDHPELYCLGQQLLVAARELEECDLAKYTLRNLDEENVDPVSELVVGRDTAVFGPPLQPGNYEVCMSASRRNLSGNSCFSVSEIQVCDTVLIDVCVGINYLKAADYWMIYPNPTKGVVCLEGETPYTAYQLQDSFGRIVRNDRIEYPLEHTLYFGDLPAGIYFLLIYDDHLIPYQHRLIIQ